jgi:hypothetical protein
VPVWLALDPDSKFDTETVTDYAQGALDRAMDGDRRLEPGERLIVRNTGTDEYASEEAEALEEMRAAGRAIREAKASSQATPIA